MKSLPGTGVDVLPARLAGIVDGEQQQQLRLQRIGVLELVDEDAREAALEVRRGPSPSSRTRSRARSSRSRKSSAPSRAFSALVARRRTPSSSSCSSAARSASARTWKSSSACDQRVARVEHLRARHALRVRRPAALARALEVAVAAQVDRAALRGRRDRRGRRPRARRSAAQPAHRLGVDEQVVAGVRRRAETVGQRVHELDEPRDRAARDRTARASTAPRKSRHSRQLEAGAAQPLDRTVLVAHRRARRRGSPRRSDRRTPSGGSSSRAWNQPSNASSNSRSACPSVSTRNSGSTRASTGRSRSRSAQNPWMVLTCASSRFCTASSSRAATSAIRRRARAVFEPLPQPQLQLAGRLLGERDGDDLADVGAAVREHAQDAPDQLGRLAGAGGGFDDERVVDRRRRCSRRASASRCAAWRRVMAGSSAPAGRRAGPAACAATRRTTSGPQTGRKSQRPHASSVGAGGEEPGLDGAVDDLQHLEARRPRHAR